MRFNSGWFLVACVLPLGYVASAAAQQADATQPAQADSASQTLNQVTVTAHFLTVGAESAMKLDVPVKDTPFSVSSYSKSFMNSIETTQVSDLYRYMTGVQRAGDTGYDISFRGFQTQSEDFNAILVDGLPGLTVRFGSPPTIDVDHIELVRGPSSVLYGQAQPGGFINIITKKPTDHQDLELEARGTTGASDVGDREGGEFSLDATGPILGNQNLLYRIVGQTAYDTGFREFAYQRQQFVAPSFTWLIGDTTQLTASVEYRKTQFHYDSYLIAVSGTSLITVPFSTSYQAPHDLQQESGEVGTLSLTHDFAAGARFSIKGRSVYHQDNADYFYSIAFAPKSTTRLALRAHRGGNTRHYNYFDTNLALPFETFGIWHKLLLGATDGRESVVTDVSTDSIPTSGVGSYTLNLLDPSYSGIPPITAFPPGTVTFNRKETTSSSAYLTDLLTPAKQLKVDLGIRYDRESQEFNNLLTAGTENSSVATKWLPMAGLVYEPTQNWSAYLSYSTSFVPVPAQDVDINGNSNFTPTSADGEEGGVKYFGWNERAIITAAVFRIKERDVPSSFKIGCPIAIGTCTHEVGAELSKGVEFEANLRPIQQLQVITGVSYTKARVTESDQALQVGARLPNYSPLAGHLWTRYDLDRGALQGLGVGVGVSYAGGRSGELPTTAAPSTLPLPAYTVADLALYYRFRRWEITAKVTNLFDQRYIQSAGISGPFNLLPGAPRFVDLSIRGHF